MDIISRIMLGVGGLVGFLGALAVLWVMRKEASLRNVVETAVQAERRKWGDVAQIVIEERNQVAAYLKAICGQARDFFAAEDALLAGGRNGPTMLAHKDARQRARAKLIELCNEAAQPISGVRPKLDAAIERKVA